MRFLSEPHRPPHHRVHGAYRRARRGLEPSRSGGSIENSSRTTAAIPWSISTAAAKFDGILRREINPKTRLLKFARAAAGSLGGRTASRVAGGCFAGLGFGRINSKITTNGLNNAAANDQDTKERP
jgi:hypothetical protein